MGAKLEIKPVDFEKDFKRNVISYKMGLEELERIWAQDRTDDIQGRRELIIHWELRLKDL